MKAPSQGTRPAIVVAAVHDSVLRELLAGIEEEGVLHELAHPHEALDVVAAAYELAGQSSLAVAITADDDNRVCVHHARAPQTQPVHLSARAVEPKIARKYGHNAARLVVGIPLFDLRPLEGDLQSPRKEHR